MQYISKYSNGKKVSAAQYITEIICEHKAIKDKEDIHYKFWSTKKWSSFYRSQIGSANKLLTEYTDKAIIRALNTNEGKKIFSLRAPHLKDIIVREQAKIDSENKQITIDYDRNKSKKHRQNNANKSIISKLKELE